MRAPPGDNGRLPSGGPAGRRGESPLPTLTGGETVGGRQLARSAQGRIMRPVVTAALAGCLMAAAAAPAAPTPPGTVKVPAKVETAPTGVAGDTADDPAIWVDRQHPAASLVITNEKKADRLTVFDLRGRVVQRIDQPTGFYGNVDARGRIVAVAHAGIQVWRVTDTPSGPRLRPAQEKSGNARTGGEGLCLYDPGANGVRGGLYAINVQRSSNRVRMHPLSDADHDGLLRVEQPTRDFTVGSEAEGCEVDDSAAALYLAEEDVGIWRYDLAAPGMNPPRTRFASVGADLAADVEGLALAAGVLYASAQNAAAPRANWVSRYDAGTGDFLGSFRVTAGKRADDCDQTDGIDAYAGRLNAAFPHGIFVCQDGYNGRPGSSGTQNFKYARLDRVAVSAR